MFTHPDYTVIRELGHGGAASVCLAVQKSLERRVAVKVLHAAALRGADAGARFLREARTVAMLEHRHVVPVFEIGRRPDEFGYFMTMEYLPGGTLHERRALGMTVGELLRALDQVAAALDCAHGRGIVHRDVKADNILFRENGEAVLSDFGIARLTESLTHMTATGAILGTAGYMSPEQVRGEPLDPRSDLYSLGIVLYEMLAGRRPFVGDSIVSTSLQHITTPPPPLEARDANFQPLVERLLAKSPDERLPDAAALREELAALSARLASESGRALGEPRTSAPVPPVARPAERRATSRAKTRRGRGAIALAAGLAGLVAIGLGRSLHEAPPPVAEPGTPVATADIALPGGTPSGGAPIGDLPPGDVPPGSPTPDGTLLDEAITADAPLDGSRPEDAPTDTARPVGETVATGSSAEPSPEPLPEPSPELSSGPSPVPALMTALDEAYLDERWFGEDPDGAVALSRRVQETEPDNTRAARRLEQMRTATRRRADTALEDGALAAAAARIDELERHWPEESGTAVDTLRVRLSEARAAREAAARAAERRRAAESALADAERALLGGELDRAGEALAEARAGLPGDERVAAVTARLEAARERLAETRRARAAAAALDARIDALAARFDDWSDDPEARLDAVWEALDAELGALSAEHPDNVSLARLNRVAERQATLIARANERAAEAAVAVADGTAVETAAGVVAEPVVEDSSDRFHLPGF